MREHREVLVYVNSNRVVFRLLVPDDICPQGHHKSLTVLVLGDAFDPEGHVVLMVLEHSRQQSQRLGPQHLILLLVECVSLDCVSTRIIELEILVRNLKLYSIIVDRILLICHHPSARVGCEILNTHY